MVGIKMYLGPLCLILFYMTGVQSTAAIPGPPTAVQITTYSVLLEFQAANESVDLYRVEYAKSPSIAFSRGVEISSINGEPLYRVEQTDLIPGATYQLRIVPRTGPRSYNAVRGIPSDTIELQIAIPAMLASPTVIQVSTYYAILEFTRANASVSSYQAEYALSGSLTFTKGSSIAVVTGQDRYRFTQSDLIPGRTYDIRIVPYVHVRYSDYKGIPSSSVSATTFKPALTSNVTVIEVSTFYATIEFSQANGPVSLYLAEYALTPSSQYSKGNTVAAVDGQLKYKMTQDDLIPGRSYYIRIVPQLHIRYRDYKGEASQPVEVTILKPALTSNLTVIKVSIFYATIECSQANGPVSSYLAEYALTPSSQYSKGNTVAAVDGQLKYKMTQDNLIPGRSYYIRIVPQLHIRYKDYKGEASQPVEETILKPAIPEPPQIIKITTSSVTLGFPASNSSVSSYQVEYNPVQYQQDIQSVKVNIIDGQLIYQVQITHLIPGKKYQMRVVPLIYVQHSEHKGLPTDYTLVTTPKPVSPLMPTIIAITTSSVILEFLATNDSKSAYTVEFAESSTLDFKSGVSVKIVDGKVAYRALQTGLIPGTHYTFRIVPIVTIFSNNYRGHPSPVVGVKTYQPVMNKAPVIKRINPSTVEVQFIPSLGTSTHYRVQYKEADSYDEVAYSNGHLVTDDGRTPTEPYTVLQSGLTENTEYKFRVLPMVAISGYYYLGTPSPTASTVGQTADSEKPIKTSALPDSQPTTIITKDESTIKTTALPDGQPGYIITTNEPTTKSTAQPDDTMTNIVVPVVMAVVIVLLIIVIVVICVWFKRRRMHTGEKKGEKTQETASQQTQVEVNAGYQRPGKLLHPHLYEELDLRPVPPGTRLTPRPRATDVGDYLTNVPTETYGTPGEGVGQAEYDYIDVLPPPDA